MYIHPFSFVTAELTIPQEKTHARLSNFSTFSFVFASSIEDLASSKLFRGERNG
jgi:hypothetical protein